MRRVLYTPTRRVGKSILPKVVDLYRAYGSHDCYGYMTERFGTRILTKCMQRAIQIQACRPVFVGFDPAGAPDSTVFFTRRGGRFVILDRREREFFDKFKRPVSVWFDELAPGLEG